MTRAEQLADAYLLVAKADHYMVGIVETVTQEEREAAHQYLITWQNAQPTITEPDRAAWEALGLALDVCELAIRQGLND